MPIPEFISELRAKVGTAPLWLIGCTAVVTRQSADQPGALEVLCVKRADTGAWTPVTGIVDPGEHPSVAAVREVLEETGITATISRLAQVGVTAMVTYHNGDQTQYVDLTYRCEFVSGEPHPADGENTDARWYSAAALPEMSRHCRQRVAAALADETAPRTVLLEA